MNSEPQTDETTVFDVTVEWPDGGIDRHPGVSGDRATDILRNLGIPEDVINGGLTHPGEEMRNPKWAGVAVAEISKGGRS